MAFQQTQQDDGVLTELGERLAQVRIQQNLTQSALARQAGIGKRTLERLEAGETTQTRTLVRILRELGLLDRLDAVLPEPTARPSHIVKRKGQRPQRASSNNNPSDTQETWTWGDEG
ncbi:MAG: helix-turn-helix transcriptional regulator [Pseudomonadota bacterium]